jgi:epoxyqueuosine reductase
VTGEPAFLSAGLPTLDELVALDEPGYRDRLQGSPLRRAGRVGLARSAAVALGNTGGDGAMASLTTALSHGDPLVRSHAAWGLRRCRGADIETARKPVC